MSHPEGNSDAILAIDIGGTGLKAAKIDHTGKFLTDRVKVPTPKFTDPNQLSEALAGLVKPLGEFSKAGAGFPGVVKEGVVLTAPRLGSELFHGYPLAAELQKRLGKEVEIRNDAEVQALGAFQGKGVEVLITFGTGIGFVVAENGRLSPRLEISVHPFEKDRTYNDSLGNAALEKIGKEKWNKRVRKALENVKAFTNYDVLYVCGGNAKKIEGRLDPNIKIVPNTLGISGVAAFWKPLGGEAKS